MIEQAHVEKILSRLPQIEQELANPATASNQRKYRSLVTEHTALSRMKEKADRYFRMLKDVSDHKALIQSEGADAELVQLAREESAQLEADLPAAEKALMVAILPPDPNENRNAIMEIRAGTGGEEAALFAGNLFRMYSHFVEPKGWKVGIIDASASEIGGYKEVVFSVEGQGAYSALQYEKGVHRVQRVPVTEASGRIHTSAATVAVFPEVEPEDDIEIPPDQVRIDIFCSSGPGGQSVNTTYSAIRVTHLPTGLVAQSQDERSQHRNKEKAMAVLKARLLDLKHTQEEEKMGNSRRSQIGTGDRSERIRTYNFPQNRLTDHRIGLTLYNLERIIEGELEPVVSALRENDIELRLAAELKKK